MQNDIQSWLGIFHRAFQTMNIMYFKSENKHTGILQVTTLIRLLVWSWRSPFFAFKWVDRIHSARALGSG